MIGHAVPSLSSAQVTKRRAGPQRHRSPLLSAAAGGAVGGGISSTGCGFGTSLVSAGAGASASFLTSASITGDWSAKGFALSVGSAVAAAAASAGLGMLCFVRGTKVTKADGSQEPIEDVELGERVLPTSAACEALDVSDWLRYEFRVDGKDRNPADALTVELLRPAGWIPDLVVGGALWLDLEELGIHGWGTLLSVTEVDVEPRGPSTVGCPVTGNFTGRNSGVMTLYLDGEEEPLELTEGHRFFSATRGDWVPAVELEVGEELQTLDGVVAVARRVVTHERVEQVFNLEVFDRHAYHVGGVGVLAHNQSAGECAVGDNDAGMSRAVDDPPNQSVAPDTGQTRGPEQGVLDAIDAAPETREFMKGLPAGSGDPRWPHIVEASVADAFGHCVAGCDTARALGETTAAILGTGHELAREYTPLGGPHDSYSQDLSNQATGRELSSGLESCGQECAGAYHRGDLDLSAPRQRFVYDLNERRWRTPIPRLESNLAY